MVGAVREKGVVRNCLQYHSLLFLLEDQPPDSSGWVCPKLFAVSGS